MNVLRQAYLYSNQLTECFANIADDEYFKYYISSYSVFELDLKGNDWGDRSYVSVDKDNNVIGYLHYSIDRYSNNVYDFVIVNFTKKINVTFALDLKKFLLDVFLKFNFDKAEWCVIVGNPIEKSYDKICEIAGGRIVGTFKRNIKLFDNEYYDKKFYEVLREDFINSKAYKMLKRRDLE